MQPMQVTGDYINKIEYTGANHIINFAPNIGPRNDQGAGNP